MLFCFLLLLPRPLSVSTTTNAVRSFLRFSSASSSLGLLFRPGAAGGAFRVHPLDCALLPRPAASRHITPLNEHVLLARGVPSGELTTESSTQTDSSNSGVRASSAQQRQHSLHLRSLSQSLSLSTRTPAHLVVARDLEEPSLFAAGVLGLARV